MTKPHVEQMQVELDQLTDRLSDLGTFIHTNEQFEKLSQSEQELMNIQWGAMVTYRHTLKARLALEDEKVEPTND